MTSDWRSHAACRGMGPDLFYAESKDNRCYDVTRALCSGCPVRGECLNEVLTMSPQIAGEYGFWGGLAPKQRRELRRRNNALTCGNGRFARDSVTPTEVEFCSSNERAPHTAVNGERGSNDADRSAAMQHDTQAET